MMSHIWIEQLYSIVHLPFLCVDMNMVRFRQCQELTEALDSIMKLDTYSR